MRAWHRGTFDELLTRRPASIADELAGAAASRRLEPNPESYDSWVVSATVLRSVAEQLHSTEPLSADWHYFMEFEVPRRSRRIDTAIIAAEIIFLIEWKVGSAQFDRASQWQAEQYALDMRDFHEGSRDRVIVPILVATAAAPTGRQAVFDAARSVQDVQCATPDELATVLRLFWEATHDPVSARIDPLTWEDSAYRPTPSIVDAAKTLYEKHDVRELSLAGAQNLDATVDAVLELIDFCRREHRRGIAFITGSPGSGKTLAGLQVVHTPALLENSEAAAVFLSGNMPLVEVITTALVNSAGRNGRTRYEVEREVRTFIQHAYAFRNEYAEHPERVPPEHVVLFDEAQRAWDAKQVESWTGKASKKSEPQSLLDVMTRVPDWAVVIALVGSGQEINRGEAGLSEWGRALEEFHSDWIVRAAPAVLPGRTAPPGGRLFDALPIAGPTIESDDRLYLQMNVRSPRAERLNQWVDNLLAMDVDAARRVFPDTREYPMVLTRDLQTARSWLRDHGDADHRTGLLASADARRLRSWGIQPETLRREKWWADWFLRERGDVRGSDQLELAATNFDCQGLEIDWAAVCWGNDLIVGSEPARWHARRFGGSKWSNVNEGTARYILNGYRVILTRARRGQIIWVPQPDGSDSTLDPDDFDRVADLLMASGVPSID